MRDPGSLAGDDAGYTLLELMIALTLLGFLSLLLFGGLKLGTRVWERSEDVSANGNRIRSVQQLLSDQIHQIYPLARANSQLDFDGEESALHFLTTASDDGALKRVTVMTESQGDAAMLSEASSDELSRSTSPAKPLLGPIASLHFAYYGAQKGEEQARWHANWRDQPRLPGLIRVSATLRDHALTFPPMIVAPRLDADQSCTLDALTNDCQGR